MEFDVRTAFVSFVDHLPSDITRKLWLIQSLNIRHYAVRDQLSAALKELERVSSTGHSTYSQCVANVLRLTGEAVQIRREVLEESKSIETTIKIAKLQLQNQYIQLEHDHKMYQNEMEMKDVLLKHSKRSNKRTISKSSGNPSIKLRLKLKNVSKGSPEGISVTPQKKKRGRPRKYPLTVEPKEEKRQDVYQSAVDEDNNDIYCICREPSFGQMVACDNPNCKIEWFHYGCVGIVRAPRGKWFCPDCTKAIAMKKKTAKVKAETTSPKKKNHGRKTRSIR
ncbi:Ing3 [Cyberlindnera jadinii]|uniref:Ing3 protein n=1 Tax=Cyberlindnera jadinii (strain ATCC 18201 / CBS 1600 / BCRC 20928 / JCM 3617 / NBRC 0987 / NRRL Y-1542) TaxID=983966 RepID=A0A0H5BZE8_CYBJN|nr:Ing3 [Cyberlindnera jadinii]